jgi:hypothetical protein
MQIDAFFSLLTLPLHFQIPKSKQKQTSIHVPCNADSVGGGQRQKTSCHHLPVITFSVCCSTPWLTQNSTFFFLFIYLRLLFYRYADTLCMCARSTYLILSRLKFLSPRSSMAFYTQTSSRGLRVTEIYVRRKEERHCIIVIPPTGETEHFFSLRWPPLSEK